MCAGPADPQVKIHKVLFIFLDQIRWMRYNLWFSQNYWMNVHKPLWKGEQWSDLEPKYFWVWIWLPGRFQGPPKVTAPSESPFIFLQWGWIDIQLLSAIWMFFFTLFCLLHNSMCLFVVVMPSIRIHDVNSHEKKENTLKEKVISIFWPVVYVKPMLCSRAYRCKSATFPSVEAPH